MATSRREKRQQAREDWRARRTVRVQDRKARKARRKEDKAAREGLTGKEKRQTRRSQRGTRRDEFRGMREERGVTRRQQRVSRKLAFKPERAAEVCSPEGAKKREVFNAVVRNPAWMGAAQYLNTSAKVLWAAPEPTMISKIGAGVSDAIGYSMKAATIAGPSINNIREDLACAMVAELEAMGSVDAEQAAAIRLDASKLVVAQWDKIPTGGSDSTFSDSGADEETRKIEAQKYYPLIAAGLVAILLARN